jgi:Type II secretion system (T2SS), protein M subtype b
MPTLSLRERKLIAIGLLIGLIGLVQLFIIGPLVGGFSDRAAERQALRDQYAHASRTIATIPRLRRLADANRTQLRAFTLAAPDPEKGGILLEDRLRAAVEGVGGELRASGHDGSDTSLSRANVAARMPLDQFVKLLALLQNQPPYLVIESLSIGADDALASQKAGPLDVKIEVSIPFVMAAAR